MTALLPLQQTVSAAPSVRRGGGSRPAPSLIRGLIQCVLLEPELARRIAVPKPLGTHGDGAALAALVAFCETSKVPLTTAGVMQPSPAGPARTIRGGAYRGRKRRPDGEYSKSNLSKGEAVLVEPTKTGRRP